VGERGDVVSIMTEDERNELDALNQRDDELAQEFEAWEMQQEKLKRRSASAMRYREQSNARVQDDEPEPIEAFTPLQIRAVGYALAELRQQLRDELKREIAVLEEKHGAELSLLRREAEFLRGLVQGTIVEMRRKPDAA
jgi:hypothetical protein